MRPRGTPNLDLTLALDKNIRREYETCRDLIQVSSDEIRVWFASKIASCKQIIDQNHDSVGTHHLDSVENGRSPPSKKMKVDAMENSNHLTTDIVCGMKVKELQHELKKLGLSTNGRKHDLKERLLDVLNEDFHKMPSLDEIPRALNDEDMEDLYEGTGDSIKVGPINDYQALQQSPSERDDPVLDECGHKKQEEELNAISSEKVEIAPSTSWVTSSSKKVAAEKETKLERSECSTISAAGTSSENHVVLSPLENAKQSRSPLRVVQSGVQSAIKKLTAKSPLTSTWSAQKKRAVAEVHDLSQKAMVSRAATKENSNCPPLTSKSAQVLTEDDDQVSDVMPTPLCDVSHVPLHPTGSAIRSMTVQAKTEARKAKLAEMRGKSKTLTNLQQAESFRPLGGLTHSVTSFTTNYEGKRMNLAAQMRAKAAAQLSQGKGIVPAAFAAKTTTDVRLESDTELVASNHPSDSTSNRMPSERERQVLAEKKKEKTGGNGSADAPGIEVLSPMDTYELSDKDESESDSDSEDGDSKEGKYVPRWAQQPVLYSLLEHQYRKSLRDPDDIFGEVQTCDLNAIFEGKKARYQKRTSSGNWTKDKLTAAETLAYKRTMQYTKDPS